MTDLELVTETGLQPVVVAQQSRSLEEWATAARSAATIAAQIATTSFVPQTLVVRPTGRDPEEIDAAHRATVHNISAAILTGYELGMQPMAACRSIDVIQGTPAMRAIALRALVTSRGHDIWVEEQTETRAIVCGQRANSDKVQRSVWTMDRARGLGLVGKDNWRKQPAAMLVARATAECARWVAPDVMLGIPYVTEELQDMYGVEQPDVKPRRPRRALVTADDAPTPDLPPEPAFVSGAPITKAQMGKLQASFNALGCRDRDRRLAVTAQLIDRGIESAAQLTKDEASVVIDTLDSITDAEAFNAMFPTSGEPE